MSNPELHQRLSRLKQAARRKRTQRGAAVFVVVLVVTLLTALGLFAVRSASLSSTASGYNRQLTQTHYIADYAVQALISTMLAEAQVHADNMMGKGGKPDTGCVIYSKLKDPTCARYSYDWLEKKFQENQSKALVVLPKSGAVAGSLGPAALEADMKLEMTDFHPAWPELEGMSANCNSGSKLGYAMVTVSAEGQVRPRQLVKGKWDTGAATAAGVEQVRAHVIMGPVNIVCK